MSGGGDFVQRGENNIVKIEINVLNLNFGEIIIKLQAV
jgi:hypothetical protein